MDLVGNAQKAYDIICRGTESLLVMGKAGTGKSSFIHHLVERTSKKVVVCAPTGIAALNAKGQTIHSLFQLPLGPILPDDTRLYHQKINAKKKKLFRELEVLIIDEISMVRADVLDAIDTILRLHSPNQSLPFGGKQLVLVGDPFQLEPVVTAQERFSLGKFYQVFYFFASKSYIQLHPRQITFDEVFRQQDKYFISLLDKIRHGLIEEEDLEVINYQMTNEFSEEEMVIVLASKRETVDTINRTRLENLKDVPQFYTGTIENQFPSTVLPAPLNLVLKIGAQVMFVKNDLEKRWVNGTLAKVVFIHKDRVEVLLENGNQFDVKAESWENIEYSIGDEGKVNEEVKGRYFQLPLQLAWAITIHKSQGLTFDKIIINLDGGSFAYGQLYVALSRCRTLEGISLQTRINPKDIRTNPIILAYLNGEWYPEDI